MRDFFESKKINTRLYESENFIVVPSLGAMVEGWVLLIPKEYSLNIASLDMARQKEMEELIDLVKGDISSKYGQDVIMFEHGPSIVGSKVGCGVDYAHLHIVPCKYDLLDGLERFLSIKYNWNKKSLFSDLENENRSYLYYRNQQGEEFMTHNEEIPSQLFRRVIAHYLNIPESFDWNKFPCLDNIENTINHLQISQ